MILKMDRRRGNIVVSRRSILEESRAEQRAEIVGNLAEGNVAEGIVKNITEYAGCIIINPLKFYRSSQENHLQVKHPRVQSFGLTQVSFDECAGVNIY